MSETLDTLKRLIVQSGRPISHIAADAGIHKALLSRLMNDKIGLNIESIEKLAKALGHEVAVIKRRKRSTTKG